MVKNEAGGCKGKKVARKHHNAKGKNDLRLSASAEEKYAIVKKVLGNTCDVICDDGKERRCIIRGKFTGRNKRDNMLDSGTYILVGLREWVMEDITTGDKSNNKNVRYCDLLEVYNSMERDILRRTHGVFGTLKDESGVNYDDRDSSVMFVDDNTLKYQNMIKNMEKSKNGGGGESGSGSGSEDELKEQSTIITASVKHIGKGIIVQSFEISDDEDGESGEDDDEEDMDEKKENKVMNVITEGDKRYNKKIVYTQEKEIDVDDI
jgi:translation initiation factor IF-1